MQLSKSCVLTLDAPLALGGQFLEVIQIFLGLGHLLGEQVEVHQSGHTSASTQARCTTANTESTFCVLFRFPLQIWRQKNFNPLKPAEVNSKWKRFSLPFKPCWAMLMKCWLCPWSCPLTILAHPVLRWRAALLYQNCRELLFQPAPGTCGAEHPIHSSPPYHRTNVRGGSPGRGLGPDGKQLQWWVWSLPEWTPEWQGPQGRSHLPCGSRRSGSAGCSTRGNRAARPCGPGTPWWLTCPDTQTQPHSPHRNWDQQKMFYISKWTSVEIKSFVLFTHLPKSSSHLFSQGFLTSAIKVINFQDGWWNTWEENISTRKIKTRNKLSNCLDKPFHGLWCQIWIWFLLLKLKLLLFKIKIRRLPYIAIVCGILNMMADMLKHFLGCFTVPCIKHLCVSNRSVKKTNFETVTQSYFSYALKEWKHCGSTRKGSFF